MKKVQIREFDPVIYPLKIWVSITNNYNALKDRFKEKSGEELNFGGVEDNEALTYFVKSKETNKNGILILFCSKKYCHAGNIAHESTHAARDIWDYIEERKMGDEADAYLVGWIAECCEKVKLNKN